MTSSDSRRVLIAGVYLVDTANHAVEISRNLKRSGNWEIDLRWAALGNGEPARELQAITALKVRQRVPKFQLINDLIDGLSMERYRYLIVTDDDIELPDGFVDAFLSLQERYDFALAQPARTHDSFTNHYFVAQLEGVAARRTRFVEIGPMVSLRSDTFSFLLPFDQSAPMGWGLDFVWPRQLEARGLRLGIVDAVPLSHSLRKPVAHYDYDETNQAMGAFLSSHEHVERQEAFVALESFPLIEDTEQAADTDKKTGDAPH